MHGGVASTQRHAHGELTPLERGLTPCEAGSAHANTEGRWATTTPKRFVSGSAAAIFNGMPEDRRDYLNKIWTEAVARWRAFAETHAEPQCMWPLFVVGETSSG